MSENITFRTQLLGGVSEFCHNSGLSILSNTLNLVELIVLLARYQEEGVRLTPEVYLSTDIDKVTSLLPESEMIKIGNSSSDVSGIKEALKKCAPLAMGGWLIYIMDLDHEIEYGLFRSSYNPISVFIDDVLMSSDDDQFKIVKIFQIADECVEISANNGEHHYIFLDHRKEDAQPPLQYLNDLTTVITEEVKPDVKEPTFGFLKYALYEALRKSHGCIIAVTNMKRSPKFLMDDGVIFDMPIDFPYLINALKKEKVAYSCLTSKVFLINGMLNSDGIMLFDNYGRLLGYNCFIKIKNKDVVGGARKRAFESLKDKVGRGLRAAFMQSQDGFTDFYGSKND